MKPADLCYLLMKLEIEIDEDLLMLYFMNDSFDELSDAHILILIMIIKPF